MTVPLTNEFWVLRSAYLFAGPAEMLRDVELVEDDPSMRVKNVLAGRREVRRPPIHRDRLESRAASRAEFFVEGTQRLLLALVADPENAIAIEIVYDRDVLRPLTEGRLVDSDAAGLLLLPS